jgi:predicted dehydrogenase
MPIEPLVRVGVLGAGAWACGAHLPGYRRDPRCRVVAIADTEIDRARKAAHDFDIPVVTADARELVGRDDIDAIDVCTPNCCHVIPDGWYCLPASTALTERWTRRSG